MPGVTKLSANKSRRYSGLALSKNKFINTALMKLGTATLTISSLATNINRRENASFRLETLVNVQLIAIVKSAEASQMPSRRR